ncbi:MAG: NAD(P)-dependent oxidoreductase [Roseburia sp.]|nr:NAD(P)-dependent oxidoreductase [Roseburia sp.]MCM1277912.1 NAD(P)-dependent oxidoreductase [Robinsoniella sp.]
MIIGEYGFMMNHLIERLYREKCDIYTIAGKRAKEKAVKLPAHNIFEFSSTGLDVKYIIQCVQPDTVIFMGAQDDAFDWNNDMTASHYSSQLTNVLLWSKTYHVKHFIYLSTMDVFGGSYDKALAEEEKPDTDRAKNMIIYNGEYLCQLYNDAVMKVTILRFPLVYGPSHFTYEKLNPIEKMCFEAKKLGVIEPVEYGSFMVIYVSDAVDAIFKTVMRENCSQHIYHVEGKGATTNEELSSMLGKELKNPVKLAEKAVKKERNISLNGNRFSEEFRYSPLIELETGIMRTSQFIESHFDELNEKELTAEEREKKESKEQFKRNLFTILKRARRIVENIALFAAVLFVTYQFGGMDMFSGVDFMLLYVLVASVAFGIGHSVLAVVLATGGNLYLRMLETGQGFSAALSQYSVIFQFLFYFIAAILISYTILRYKTSMKEQDEQMGDLQEEYELIYDVNKTNVEIKRVFEDRLLNYGDSIGKIYNIVSELDVLDPEKIAVASLGVVRKIMNVKDICIYKTGQGEYFHFIEATTEEARNMKRAIKLSDYPRLQQAMETRDIFVNHQVGSELPRMAAPIYSENKLIYIIMLWNMEFEQLNTYQKNLFLVLAKIITSSLEKGYQYEEVGRLQKYYENTNVLFPELFRKQIEEKLKDVPYEQAEYSVIQVSMGEETLQEISSRLSMLVRDEDKIGKLEEEDSLVYILAHAGYADVPFVVNKLNKNGLESKAVVIDEF